MLGIQDTCMSNTKRGHSVCISRDVGPNCQELAITPLRVLNVLLYASSLAQQSIIRLAHAVHHLISMNLHSAVMFQTPHACYGFKPIFGSSLLHRVVVRRTRAGCLSGLACQSMVNAMLADIQHLAFPLGILRALRG